MNANAVIALLAWERIKWKARVVQAQFLWASPLPSCPLRHSFWPFQESTMFVFDNLMFESQVPYVPYALQASFALTWFNMGADDDGEWRTKAFCCGQSCALEATIFMFGSTLATTFGHLGAPDKRIKVTRLLKNLIQRCCLRIVSLYCLCRKMFSNICLEALSVAEEEHAKLSIVYSWVVINVTFKRFLLKRFVARLLFRSTSTFRPDHT